MSVSDELMFRYYELLSDLSVEEIGVLKEDIKDGKLHPKAVKMRLARELTERFHSPEEALAAERNFEQVFSTHQVPADIPECRITGSEAAIWLPKLLLDTGLVKSTSDGRRMVKQNAVSLDGEKVSDVDMNIPARGGVLIKVGKRRFCQVVLE